jgi:hypothetical protein
MSERSHRRRRDAEVIFGSKEVALLTFGLTRSEASSHEGELAQGTPWCRRGVFFFLHRGSQAFDILLLVFHAAVSSSEHA